jgi:indolepyruvate ferredoxin oxidoreductase alpha subunit
MHSCGCMSASIGVAHGARKAGSRERHIAVLGDSTFLHSGIADLLNVVHNNSDTVVVILDNRTTAMTGHQETAFSRHTLQGQTAVALEFEPLVRALGVDHVHTVDAYDLRAIETALKDCLDRGGPAVLVVSRPCTQLPWAELPWERLEVDPERCIACHTCLRLGCPAMAPTGELGPRERRHKVQISALACVGCGLCSQVCPEKAIIPVER